MQRMHLRKLHSYKIVQVTFMRMFQIYTDSVYPCAIRDKGSVQNEVRQRAREAPVHTPPILEATFDPGTCSGRIQAQCSLRTQSRFDQSIAPPIPPQNGDLWVSIQRFL
ncbi:hypothetical protein PoB_002802600 [Plakobranchus ocellatus]|uniref:Uncharacterized protein n=1 Tax=Plakobranchus ocellatus TaxID=259542 RepID=A0AAV4A035_9GAST|nr:hypothetical protein PoB_002802600 [Plakobranchus ocellatus]